MGKALFLERPYDQVSMDDLAARAGVSKGLFFHYFESKRDLYVELVRRAADELLEATFTPVEQPPLERLQAGLVAYLTYVKKNERAYVGLLAGGVGLDPELAQILDGVRRAFAERLLEAFPGGRSRRSEMVARGFVGFVEAASLAWVERGDERPEELVELFVRVLAAGLEER